VIGFAITDLFCLLNYHLALFKFVLAKFAVITEFHFIFEHSISQFVFLLEAYFVGFEKSQFFC